MIKRLLDQLAERISTWFPLLPTESALRADFPHSTDCACDRKYDTPQLEDVGLTIFDPDFVLISNLEKLEKKIYMQGGTWSSGITYTSYYLKCRHCGAVVQYRQE